jgi:endonuclease III
VHQLVFACLACEAGDAAATEAVAAVRGAFVDYNELRVASASDIAGVIGRKSVVAERRASWVRAALRGVFDRSNALTLEDVRDGGKRGARQSIEKLGELPAYVVARVCLHGLGAHAFPVDERLSRLLAAHGVVGAGMGAAEASAVVERLVRAGEAAGAHLALEAAAAGLKGEGSARGARGTAGTREGRGVKSASAADTKEQPGSARRPGSTREKTGAPRRGSGRAS